MGSLIIGGFLLITENPRLSSGGGGRAGGKGEKDGRKASSEKFDPKS